VRGDDHEGECVEGGKAMTRQEMASAVDDAVGDAKVRAAEYRAAGYPSYVRKAEREDSFVRDLEAAAAELRKTCTGCRHFRGSLCRAYQVDGGVDAVISVPLNGSGFCHEWSAK